MSENRKTDIVLVHGAWHGGWCWEKLAEVMRKDNVMLHMPTLSGLGERADELNRRIGLQNHIEDITQYIESRNLEGILLVGHSYGGMVITGVADRMKDRIGHIVYLDAALPRHNESMISYAGDQSAEQINAATQQLAKLAPDGIAMQPLPAAAFGIAPDHQHHDWVQSRLTPHPFKTWTDRIELANGGPQHIPRSYILCTAPLLENTGFAEIAAMARNCAGWTFHELQTGHDAMVTAPSELAGILRNISLEMAG